MTDQWRSQGLHNPLYALIEAFTLGYFSKSIPKSLLERQAMTLSLRAPRSKRRPYRSDGASSLSQRLLSSSNQDINMSYHRVEVDAESTESRVELFDVIVDELAVGAGGRRPSLRSISLRRSVLSASSLARFSAARLSLRSSSAFRCSALCFLNHVRLS